MLKKNQKGMIDPIFIVVLVLVLAVGGFAYWRVDQNNKSKNSNTSAATQSEDNTSEDSTSDEVGADDSILDPSDLFESYTVPEGWEEKECQPGNIALTPPDVKSPNCDANQPDVAGLISIQDNYDYIDPTLCSTTETKRLALYSESAGFVSYDCEEVIVSEEKGIYEVLVENEQGFAGSQTVHSYIFPVDGRLLVFSYADPKDKSNADNVAKFEEFVKSVKFQ